MVPLCFIPAARPIPHRTPSSPWRYDGRIPLCLLLVQHTARRVNFTGIFHHCLAPTGNSLQAFLPATLSAQTHLSIKFPFIIATPPVSVKKKKPPSAPFFRTGRSGRRKAALSVSGQGGFFIQVAHRLSPLRTFCARQGSGSAPPRTAAPNRRTAAPGCRRRSWAFRDRPALPH